MAAVTTTAPPAPITYQGQLARRRWRHRRDGRSIGTGPGGDREHRDHDVLRSLVDDLDGLLRVVVALRRRDHDVASRRQMDRSRIEELVGREARYGELHVHAG